jgi:hypothetical protein
MLLHDLTQALCPALTIADSLRPVQWDMLSNAAVQYEVSDVTRMLLRSDAEAEINVIAGSLGGPCPDCPQSASKALFVTQAAQSTSPLSCMCPAGTPSVDKTTSLSVLC